MQSASGSELIRYGIDILYTAPTAIRTHMKWGSEYAERQRRLETF